LSNREHLCYTNLTVYVRFEVVSSVVASGCVFSSGRSVLVPCDG
jgi:hypothetical protein